MNEHAEWLRAELPVLLREGVIDAATAERLGRRYAAAEVPAGSVVGEAVEVIRASAGQPLSRALVICAVLGAGLIGLGLIQIIAHDWDQWTKPQRLALAFGPLLALQALGAWVLRARATSRAWGEGVATALALAGAGTLALVGQLYHFPGDIDAYVLAVGLMALPLVYVYDSVAAAICFLVGITATQSFRVEAWSALPLEHLALLVLLAPFAWPLLRGPPSWRGYLFGLVFVLSLVATVLFSTFRADEHWTLLRLALLAAIFALAGRKRDASGIAPLIGIGHFGGAIMALAATWPKLWPEVSLAKPAVSGWLPIEALIWAVLLVFAWRCRKHVSADRWWLAALPFAVWLGIQLVASSGFDAAALLFNGYVLVLGVLILRRGLGANQLAVTNHGLIIIAALILMRFFDSNLPFLVRGFAFMAVGAAFLGANIWLRRRRA